MGNLNSCFDHERIKASSEKIQTIYDDAYITSFSNNISDLITDLSSQDENHEVLTAQIEALEAMPTTLEKVTEEIEILAKGMKESIEAYDEAEGSMFLFLNDLSTIIANTLGNETVAKFIEDGQVNKNTIATTTDDFVTGATEEVTNFISNYAKYFDDNCPSAYASSEEWKEALEAKYEALGYSSYDASDLAYAEMAKWRTAQTGAEVTTNAISEFAEETYTDMEETVKTEYNELVDKYKNLGATEEQAKELATAESEYIDASEVAKESPDNWAYSTSNKKYSEWQKLKEEYGITEESSNNSGTASEQSADPGTKDTTTDSGNGGGGNSSGNDIQPRKTSTGTGNSSSGTNSSSQNNNSSSPSENNSSSQNQNTPSNGTEEKPSNGNENSVISEGEEKVPETPSDEKPSTTPEPDNPSSNNNNNSNSENSNNNQGNTESNNNTNNTNNNGTVNNNTSNGGNSNYYPPSNNGNSGGSSSGGNYTGGGSSNAPSTGAGTPNDNVSTTPSAPESDTSITDNTGETLDVISIDKDGGKSSVSTSSNDGGSVVPTILGVGVAGAAAVAGAKILHDKKKKDNEYSYEEDEADNDNSFANLDTYSGDDTTDTAVTMSPGKYRAGSANNLVLEEAPSEIRIDESIADIPNQKEELE